MPPPGYAVNHVRFQLGRGHGAFERAKQAIREWRMFDVGWIELCWPDAPIQPRSTVAVVVAHLGFWSVNTSRIVYVIDERRRYGFAYGTLLEHAEAGEERFTVEWADDDSVWYDVLAFSREKQLLAKIGYPVARILQNKFRSDTGRAMQAAVAAER
jgi:uncharacterized protein (UPF0548 family)